MASLPLVVLLLLGSIRCGSGLELPLRINASAGIDGHWPTLPVLYGTKSGSINCHMTLWNTSVLVLHPQCAPSSLHPLCPPDFESQDPISVQSSDSNTTLNVTQMMLDNWLSDVAEDGNILSVLHLTGEAALGTADIQLAGSNLATGQIRGDNLTAWASHLAKPMALSSSLLSLEDIATALQAKASSDSRLIGMHLGSVEPSVPPSLHVGGYDSKRIMGSLLKINHFEYSDSFESFDFAIFSVRIGVEQGFLPLKTLLPNGSYPIGPYQTDRRFSVAGKTSMVGNVKFEPGTPYLHLPNSICGPLADTLNLTYDVARNIYLWNYDASHPLFRSPTYLEFLLGTGNNIGYAMRQGETTDSDHQAIKFTTVKIPFALLRPTFQAVVDPVSGARYPPRAYFPCSPTDPAPEPDSDDYSWRVKSKRATLGRAFLQSAFFGIQPRRKEEQLSTYWVGQAPGPTDLARNVILASDNGFPTTNLAIPPNAWTNSWSGPLPIWTVDADGQTTLAERTEKPPALDQDDKILVGVGVPLGVIAGALLVFFTWNSCIKSQRKWKKIREEIAEENDTARNRELMAQNRQRKQRLAGATATTEGESAEIIGISHDISVVQCADLPETRVLLTDTDAITSSSEPHGTSTSEATHKIPRKPVPSQ